MQGFASPFPHRTPVAAVSRSANLVDVFAVGRDGVIIARYGMAAGVDGTERPPLFTMPRPP